MRLTGRLPLVWHAYFTGAGQEIPAYLIGRSEFPNEIMKALQLLPALLNQTRSLTDHGHGASFH
jgi:hypothetical protein